MSQSKSIDRNGRINQPIQFQYSDYDYKIRFGVVELPGSISWIWNIYVSDWETAKEFIDLWHESKEYPAINVSLDYRGDK